MKRRRMLFATPFVLVVGCKRPIEPVTPGEHDETEDDRAPTYIASSTPSNIDAPMAWPTRIDPPDIDAAPFRYTGCGRHPDGTFTTCNPPPPGWDAGGTGNPPPPARFRIVNLQVSGTDVIAVVGGGSAQGIAKDWKATLVDNDGVPTRADVVIVRIDKTTTTVKIRHVASDPVNAGFVRFSPP